MIYILFKCSLPYGGRKEFHEAYSKQTKLLEKHGAKLIGVWDVDFGPCCDFVMMWAAEDHAAYEKTLAGLRQDPETKDPSSKVFPMWSNCERWFMKPAFYSPLK